jgi:Cu/Ag efflux protein CusF
MKRTHIPTLALIAMLAAAGCTQKPPPGPPPSGVIKEGLVTATATVKKIDQKSREVTLTLPDGSTKTIHAGPEVRNLAQVKAGDQVTVTYFGSLSFQVIRKGAGATPGVAIAEDAVRAEPGERPGAAGARVVTVTTTIKAIDKKAGTVTLAGLDGGEDVVVQARNPDNLNRVAVGDSVEITMTEAVGIDVSAPQK